MGVLDWEFAYAAPAQFSYDPPWWLLLRELEEWPGGYRPWSEAYEPRLRIFLRMLKREEEKMEEKGSSNNDNHRSGGEGGKPKPPTLSQCMRESWEKRTWMVNYTARNSRVFDAIWWKFLDEGYFRPNENQDHPIRLELLSWPQREAMEALVARKMEESKNQRIVRWQSEEALAQMAKLLRCLVEFFPYHVILEHADISQLGRHLV